MLGVFLLIKRGSKKQGYDEVIIQSDNFKNVISISDRRIEGPKTTLIRRIQQILTNALDQMTLSIDEILHMFEDPHWRLKKS